MIWETADLESTIRFLQAFKHRMPWRRRVMLPFWIWAARKLEPYRQKRIAAGKYDAERHSDYHAGQG